MKFCQKCGTQNTDEATICTNCGNAFATQTPPAQTNTQVVQVNNIVPKKKRKGCLIAFIIIAIIAVFIGIGSSGGEEEPEKEVGDIGSYNVVVKDHFLAENYSDEKVIVVTYTFTNKSEIDTSFGVAMYDQCFQNGIELSKEFFADIENYNTDNSSKTIKPGASLDVQQAYILNDDKTTIDVEISEFLGFSDPITFTIELE